jgi:enamine deaminase RidA (YjgF/YER057c/UK114 family)
MQHIRSGSPYEERYGFSRAVRVGDRVFVAGTAPIPRTGEALAGTAYTQTLRCGEIILAALAEVGASATDVVRTRMFIVDPADADDIGNAHREIFGEAKPAATMVVTRLLDPAWKVEIEAEAVVEGSAR